MEAPGGTALGAQSSSGFNLRGAADPSDTSDNLSRTVVPVPVQDTRPTGGRKTSTSPRAGPDTPLRRSSRSTVLQQYDRKNREMLKGAKSFGFWKK